MIATPLLGAVAITAPPCAPNCCPTGGFDHTSWRWNGSKSMVARRWHNQSYNP